MSAGRATGLSRNLKMIPLRLRNRSGPINNTSFKEVPRNLPEALKLFAPFQICLGREQNDEEYTITEFY